MIVPAPKNDREWDDLLARCAGQSRLDLGQFERGSSALLALICTVKAGLDGDAVLTLTNAPTGLSGLARVAGVEQWFEWE